MIDVTALTISTIIGLPVAFYFSNLLDKDYRQKLKIQKDLQDVFEENNIKNSKGIFPKIINLELLTYGFKLILDIRKICTYDDIEKLKGFLKSTYGAKEIEIIDDYSAVNIEVINNPVTDMQYKYIPLPPKQLLIGFDYKGNPIIVDMVKTPHLLITGLSGQGKTGLINTIIKNFNNENEFVILNGFKDDFKGNKHIRHIFIQEEVKNFLETIIEVKKLYKKPLYIVLEELSMIKDKDIIKAIKELLCYGRHYNIFVIGIVQISTKEEFQAKSYFNARLSFRQIENSSYQVALGITVQEQLKKREFVLVADKVCRGKTYTLDDF